ncbi:MAG: hypothetical protein HYR63_21295 [Proteobacteria bacterium]|nr:hypothetical protein [Pseudomonadota bacterium]MBI3500090.1 hypothetical protein [Pseudomonadota bacterium]
MAIIPKIDLVKLTDALEALGADLRTLFEAVDWTMRRLDSRQWITLRARLTEFESLSVMVEARRATLDREAASTLKPWLDRLIYDVAHRALAAEARLAQRQYEQAEIPLFGRELFNQALRRLDRLVGQVKATSLEPDQDQMIFERVERERKGLLDLIRRSPDIPDFSMPPARTAQPLAA